MTTGEGLMGSAILMFEDVKVLLIVAGVSFFIGVWAIIQGEIESGQLSDRFFESKLLKWWQKLRSWRESNSNR